MSAPTQLAYERPRTRRHACGAASTSADGKLGQLKLHWHELDGETTFLSFTSGLIYVSGPNTGLSRSALADELETLVAQLRDADPIAEPES